MPAYSPTLISEETQNILTRYCKPSQKPTDKRSTFHSISFSSVSTTFGRSVEHMCGLCFFTLEFSMAYLAIKMISDVDLFCI